MDVKHCNKFKYRANKLIKNKDAKIQSSSKLLNIKVKKRVNQHKGKKL